MTGLFAPQSCDASFAPSDPEDQQPRKNCRRRFNQRAPATADDRAIPGYWEGDLLLGSHNIQIASLVERQTLYVMLVKVAGEHAGTVVNTLIEMLKNCPGSCTNR